MIPRVHSWLNKHILCSWKHPGDNEKGTSVRRHELFLKFFLAEQKYLVAYFTEDTVSRAAQSEASKVLGDQVDL